MTKQNTETRKPIIDWEPAPGFLLCKALKREELAALYNRSGGGNLSLPDNVGKVSDAVGVAQVLKLAKPLNDGAAFNSKQEAQWQGDPINIGDYIAFMPFTDLIIEIDGQKYSLVGYDKIRAVRKGDK